MADTSKPIPIVVCGKAEIVGKMVIEGLKPEYEVILFCLGSKPTAAELPFILRGIPPPSPSSSLGTGSYSSTPYAVIMGAAWSAEDVASVKAAIDQNTMPPPFPSAFVDTNPNPLLRAPILLRNDTSRPTPKPPSPEYAAQLVVRIRACLGTLLAGEKPAGPGEEGVVWY
ncbi:uncharacterized protein F4812DRAFT_157417 [Daldinia caldariorum]|uniref:uncharacterized protein n=1 Tax=Daldinia caldariorum TaxID=326644 RepID=UPI0020087D05|nr:uncharacterized protein F4812DRAFT_157417 [Daldinia caldariorum]KAI1464512.1 hypothetical protein F4812DRAFT_157417 [Daldinia caldariorum]